MPDESKYLVIANGFGASRVGVSHPLPSNLVIAETAADLAFEFSCDIFTQRDIVISQHDDNIGVIYAAKQSTSTWLMNQEAAAYAKDHGKTHLIVVGAAPWPFPHISRCVRDLRMALDEVDHAAIILTCDNLERDANGTWLCRESSQWWTRNGFVWALYEGALTCLPFPLYRWITS